jgi:hypothetical protein
VAAGVAHLNLDVVAVSGCFLEAESLVERVCTVVERKDIQDQVLALLVGLAQQRGDEVSADPAPLMTGMDFDAVNVDFAGAVLDVEHADISAVGGDDLPAVRVEPAVPDLGHFLAVHLGAGR